MRRGILSAGVLLLAACGSSSTPPNPESSSSAVAFSGPDVVIGVVANLTGPGAQNSIPANAAMQVAVDQINAAGGIMHHRVRLAVEDDQQQPSLTGSVVRKLVNDNNVATIVFNTGSADVIQVKPLLITDKVVGISPLSLDQRQASPPDNAYSFMMASPISDVGKVYASGFAAAGVHKVALFGDDAPSIAGLMKSMTTVLQAAGITVAAQETAASNAPDVTAQASRIKAANPDAALVVSFGGQLEVNFYNALQTVAPTLPKYTLLSIGNQPDAWSLAHPNALDGLVYVGQFTDRNPMTGELTTILKKGMGSKFTALTAFEAEAYDAVYVLKAAMDKAATVTDGAAIKSAMEQINGFKVHFGQPGYALSYSAGNHFGVTSLCALVLGTFKGNTPGPAWSTYQPPCS